jgi:hypothetical protein
LILLALVAMEGLMRGWMLITGRSQHPAVIRKEIVKRVRFFTENIPLPQHALDANSPLNPGDKEVLNPYCGYDRIFSASQITLENSDCRRAQHPDEFNIIVMGGSVAGMFGGIARHIFLERLQQDPYFEDKRLHLVSHAVGGHKQPQQATLLSYLLSTGYQPDAIINIDGFNEAALGFTNGKMGIYPLYPYLGLWGKHALAATNDERAVRLVMAMLDGTHDAERTADLALRFGFHGSCILGHLTLKRLDRIKTDYVDAYDRYMDWLRTYPQQSLSGPEYEKNDEAIIRLIVQSWIEASVSMNALCKERSIHYLHALQPTLWDEGSKPATDEEIRKGLKTKPSWIKGARLIYPRLREGGREITARGVHFSDCSRVFQDLEATVYFDVCHFEGEGQNVFCNAVADAFLASLKKEGQK